MYEEILIHSNKFPPLFPMPFLRLMSALFPRRSLRHSPASTGESPAPFPGPIPPIPPSSSPILPVIRRLDRRISLAGSPRPVQCG